MARKAEYVGEKLSHSRAIRVVVPVTEMLQSRATQTNQRADLGCIVFAPATNTWRCDDLGDGLLNIQTCAQKAAQSGDGVLRSLTKVFEAQEKIADAK